MILLKQLRLAILFALALAVALPAVALAGAPIPSLTGRVVDSAAMLGSSQVQRLTDLLAAYENATGNQIVVATIPTLDGDSLEDYSIRLADAWGIGNKENDNGIILLVSEQERLVRIEVGYGLEGVLPDGAAGDIIRNTIVPAFKNGDYDGGVLSGVSAMIRRISPDFQYAGMTTRTYTASRRVRSSFSGIMVFLFILFSIVAGLAGRGRGHYRRGFSSSLAQVVLWSLLSSGSSSRSRGGGWSSGGGFGGGGGGFSGGGGGFGGGGASGGW